MLDGRLPRRRFLGEVVVGGAALATAGGCWRDPQPSAPPPAAGRDDVPLRLLICGQPSWGEAISTAWGGIASQPLQITVIDPPEHVGDNLVETTGPAAAIKTSALALAVQTAIARCDVAIVPSGLIADLDEAEAIVPLASDLVASDELDIDQWFPVLRDSLMPWGGRPLALPLGCPQPAWFASVHSITDADAAVLFPTTDGAAAKLFLWQANQANPPVWLFDRASMQPTIESDAYVQTLQAMQQAFQTLATGPLSPGEIWGRLAADDFSLAIGWPAPSGDPPRVEPLPDLSAAGLPSGTGFGRGAEAAESSGTPIPLLADIDSPLGVISASCRQSAAAKRFLTWLAVGEGRPMVRRTIAGLTPLRESEPAESSDAAGDLLGPYDRYLRQRLTSVTLRPHLRIHAHDRYLAVLDQHVLACLQGDQPPADALAAVAARWSELTHEIGVPRQAKAWRMAQGLRN